ncbi:MAG: hypothetical protein LBU51_07535, partial [Bacteroidales bacterium]|nr:hypothetical protein [Bacteroidales bacterium]
MILIHLFRVCFSYFTISNIGTISFFSTTSWLEVVPKQCSAYRADYEIILNRINLNRKLLERFCQTIIDECYGSFEIALITSMIYE